MYTMFFSVFLCHKQRLCIAQACSVGAPINLLYYFLHCQYWSPRTELNHVLYSIFISVLGAGSSIFYYSSSNLPFQEILRNSAGSAFTTIKTLFQNKWFFDFIGMQFIGGYKRFSSFIAQFDQLFFDGIVNFTSLGTISLGESLKYTTTGSLQVSLVLFVIAYNLFFYFMF